MSTNQNYSSTYKRKTKKVSSRLVKKEETKVKKQTTWIVLITIVMLLLFVFVLMPGAIRLFFNFLDSDTGLDTSDSLPPQVPVLSSPATATSSASIALNGYGEPKSKVFIIVDGTEVADVSVDDDGKFSHNLKLVDGENTFVLYSADEAGNESPETKSYVVLMDAEDPPLELESPEDGANYELRKNQMLHIKGITEPNAKVYVNGRIVRASEDGMFEAKHQMSEGENKILLKAEDKAGNSVEKEVIVHFKF